MKTINMKIIKVILIILFNLIILSSCKTSGNLVIGSWKCTDFKQTSVMASPQEKKPNVKPAEFIDDNSSEGNSKASAISFENRLEGVQSAFPEIMSAFVLNSDKTSTITYRNKTLNGKWKLNEKANIITVTDIKTRETSSFKFYKIDPGTLKIITSFSHDTIQVFYKKQ